MEDVCPGMYLRKDPTPYTPNKGVSTKLLLLRRRSGVGGPEDKLPFPAD